MLLLAVAAGAIAVGLLTIARRGAPDPLPGASVVLGSVTGAVALGLADTAPTGWEPFDLLLRVGFGALVPIAASRAGLIATGWLVLAAMAVVGLVEPPGAGATACATGALLASSAGRVRSPGLQALVAAAAVGPLAHAEWPLATGASAAAMAFATMPVLLAGLARASDPSRRRIGWAIGIAVLVVAFGAVAGVLAALDAKDDLDTAVRLARDGIDQLGDDGDAARRALRTSAERFDAGADDLRTWWARPALLVPGVAQQARAVSTMASAGADLARTAATASEDADVDAIRPRGGRVDLDALIALQEPLDRSLAELHRAADRLAEVDSSLLLGPVADRLDDVRREVADAADSAELAAEAVAVAPDLLGRDGPRRYFLALQTPSEQRGNGGFMGSWAEITADGGLLELSRSGRLRDLLDVQQAAGPVGGPRWGIHNFSPDNPTVSRLVADLYPRSGGAEVDGVFHLTPAAFAAFLELTGPVDVAGYPQRLEAGTAERILLHEQYLEFPAEQRDDREEFLADAVEALFDELTSGELPGPRVLADVLGPAVAGRDLQLWSRHEAEQALFTTIDADGDQSRGDVDSVGVVTQNFAGNKIDWFLHRSLDLDLRWNPDTGATSGTLTVGLENRAPASGLPQSIIGWGGDLVDGQIPVADGENLMLMTLYSTFPIAEVRVGGETVDHEADRELGHHTATFLVSVPPGGRRQVRATVEGRATPGPRHTVRVLRQPTVHPDEVRIVLSVPPGHRFVDGPGGRSAELRGRSDRPLAATFRATKWRKSHALSDLLRGTG